MTRLNLLTALKSFTESAVKDLMLPVKIQQSSETSSQRAASVYLMRLPDSRSAAKKAPYILHQLLTGRDQQKEGEKEEATAQIRSIFCVYNDDEQEGSLALLNIMERLRISILRQTLLDGRYQIDLDAGLETMIYPDDTAPYYVGEMISTWKLPAVKREVNFLNERFQSN